MWWLVRMSSLATRLMRPLGLLIRGVQDALLPQTCVIGGEWIPGGGPPTCAACDAALTDITQTHYCPRCGRTMPPPAVDSDGCARCKHESFWNVAGVVRIGAYEPPIRRLVTALKYGGRERNAELAGRLLAAALAARDWSRHLDYLVPVPMHWFRRWQRPCDHAALLAAVVARELDVRLLRACARIKHTPSQVVTTSRTQRFDNVRGCFAVRRGAPRKLAGRCVCIIDNLISTGATVHEVSKTLRRAGARRIYAAVIARTTLPGDIQATPPRTVGHDPPSDSAFDR